MPERRSRNESDRNDDLMLTKDEVRRLVRLLADAMVPDDGRAAKCARLMNGLSEWVGADGWFWVRTRHRALGTTPPVNLDFIYGGDIGDQQIAAFGDRSLEVNGVPPEHPPMRRLLARGKHYTVTRPQIVPDSEWFAPLTRAHVKRMGLDEVLFSWVPLQETDGDTLLSGCVLFRRIGKPAFTAHEAQLVHTIFAECGPLHADGLNAEVSAKMEHLTPRQRVVLALLTEGLTVPKLAERLCISPHTAKDHVRAIYRHFGVNSRTALLKRFMAASPVTNAGVQDPPNGG